MSEQDFRAAMELMRRRKREKTETHYADLQDSERSILQAAVTIYAAYIRAGEVRGGNEKELREKAVSEALDIAERVENLVSDQKEVAGESA